MNPPGDTDDLKFFVCENHIFNIDRVQKLK
jgi:hypothetical protein